MSLDERIWLNPSDRGGARAPARPRTRPGPPAPRPRSNPATVADRATPNRPAPERPAPDRPAPRYRRVPRTPALDGLRGLAIAAVALFHYPITHSVFVGGLFGVGLFFVLSGFLVTPILAAEHDRLGRVRMGQYLQRRAWRLLPALVVFLAFFLAMDAAFGNRAWFGSSPLGRGGPGQPVGLPLALKGVGAALTYTYNFFLAHGSPMPQPLGHLWTLSVEGQFYVVWALLVAWLLRRGSKALAAATAILVALSALVPLFIWRHGAGQNWIYFGTPSRVDQLLAGALLAQAWSLGLLKRVPAWALRAGAVAGGATLLYLIVGVGNVGFKYLGAIPVVAGAGVLVIAHLVEGGPSGWGSRALGWKPLVWLGQRSYAVYLWHWPLAQWTNLLPHRIGVPLGIGCSLIAAELSWRLVEAPAQRLARRWRH